MGGCLQDLKNNQRLGNWPFYLDSLYAKVMCIQVNKRDMRDVNYCEYFRNKPRTQKAHIIKKEKRNEK